MTLGTATFETAAAWHEAIAAAIREGVTFKAQENATPSNRPPFEIEYTGGF